MGIARIKNNSRKRRVAALLLTELLGGQNNYSVLYGDNQKTEKDL